MRDFLDQIRQTLEANLYYTALFASLAVPDICGALESENGRSAKRKYVRWFNRYVAPRYRGNLTGDDCYLFRCSVLHQGRSQHTHSRYSRILFVEPSSATIIYHNNILHDALNIDVRIFCSDIVSGALGWLEQNQNTPNYIRNYRTFMKRYPNGLAPYIVGVPVIG